MKSDFRVFTSQNIFSLSFGFLAFEYYVIIIVTITTAILIILIIIIIIIIIVFTR